MHEKPQEQGQQQQGAGVAVDWANPKDSIVDSGVAEIRQNLQGYFGEIGFTSSQATAFLAKGRAYRNAEYSDGEVSDRHQATEYALQREWGENFDRYAKVVEKMKQEFEKRFSHEDLRGNVCQCSWSDIDVDGAL